MEPTNGDNGEKKVYINWPWIKAEAEKVKVKVKKFGVKYQGEITCIATACVVEVFMIRRAIRQTEERVQHDWWVVGVDMAEPDNDGRDRIFVQHRNGYEHSFSREHKPKPLMDQVFGEQKK